MLEVCDLSATRGDRLLFAGVNFKLGEGELLHVRGHNGSGKTTLLRILCGLMAPSDGRVSWMERDIHRHRDVFNRSLFYFGHLPALKDDLSGLENLRISCELAGQRVSVQDASDALAKMGLAGFETLSVNMLSQGQRRRVALARLLLSNATLWVLDEPFTALDVAAVDMLSNTVRDHVETGGCVVLTTHQEVNIGAGRSWQLELGR